jgi:flagellar hook-associated protein 2
MAITAAGVGSGLDIEGIVSQLLSLERRPLNALEQRESKFKTELSAFGRLKGSVSAFQDAMKALSSQDKFRVFSAQSSDEDVLTASADSSAAAGTYAVQVDRLAQNHKLGSDEVADTATFGGSAGDTLDLTVGSDTLSVDLSSAKTLSEIRDAINDDANNPGVTATILNTGSGVQRLILTADESGYDQRVQLSYGGSIGAGTLNLTTANKDSGGAAIVDLTQLDAAFSVDGYALTSASNKAAGVIDGITLELQQIGSSNLTLSRDTDKIKESAEAFVKAYNDLQKTFTNLRNGDLKGDSTVLSIQRQLRGAINTEPTGLSGSYTALFSVGISTNAKTGQLEFDSADFEAALDADYAGVAELFANDDQGYAFRFEALADSMLDNEGLIDSREEGLNARIKTVQGDQLDMEYRLQLREKALRSQYAALDSLVGRLNSTSQFLFQQLG